MSGICLDKDFRSLYLIRFDTQDSKQFLVLKLIKNIVANKGF